MLTYVMLYSCTTTIESEYFLGPYSSLASHFSLSLELRVVFLIGMCLKQREHWVVMFL